MHLFITTQITKRMKEWFAQWFDSPHYHQLYGHRDEQEAEAFISKLIQHLQPAPQSNFLDLACGKGRHTRSLSKSGDFEVIGLDLSPQSIEEALKLSTGHTRVSFAVHDMRRLFRTQYFDAIFCLFTSFGYFKTEHEHALTLQQIYKGLKPEGYFVLDFLNVLPVLPTLPQLGSKTVGQTTYQWRKYLENKRICKNIQFQEHGKDYEFTEQVRAFTLEELTNMMQLTGFKNLQVFGNYQLEDFAPDHSPRLILIAQK